MKKYLLLILLNLLLVYCSYAQQPNWGYGPAISVTSNGSSITYSAYDYEQNQTHSGSASGVITYINNDGVLAWQDNGYINYVIYDVKLHNFVSSSYSQSNVTSFKNNNQVVASMNNSYIEYATYDAYQHQWQHSYYSSSNPVSLIVADGVVASMNASYVEYATYDAMQHQWMHSYYSQSNGNTLTNDNGVVASKNNSYIEYAVYDPQRHQWMHSYYSSSNAGTLLNNYSVVASYNGSYIEYAVYDPDKGSWEHSYSSGSSITNFYLDNGTVRWTQGSTSYSRGYDGSWGSGTTRLKCWFYPSATSGAAPLFSYFACMSIGADSYSYNTDDNHTISRKNGWKYYKNGGNYNPVLTVSNSAANSTCSQNIIISATENKKGLPIYIQNPVKEKLVIHNYADFTGDEIVIFDLVGKQLYRGLLSNSSSAEIPVENFASGLYILKIGNSTVKWIKE